MHSYSLHSTVLCMSHTWTSSRASTRTGSLRINEGGGGAPYTNVSTGAYYVRSRGLSALLVLTVLPMGFSPDAVATYSSLFAYWAGQHTVRLKTSFSDLTCARRAFSAYSLLYSTVRSRLFGKNGGSLLMQRPPFLGTCWRVATHLPATVTRTPKVPI